MPRLLTSHIARPADGCDHWRRTWPGGDGVLGLGPLEAKIMDVLWTAPQAPLSVGDVRRALCTETELAYTTVKTVLDNLHRKGWVTRQPAARSYHYLAVNTRESAAAQAVCQLMSNIDDISRFVAAAAFYAPAGMIDVVRDALNALPAGPVSRDHGKYDRA